MPLNDDIVDIENPDGICSLTFFIHEFSGIFLHSSIFSIIYARPVWIINGALSEFTLNYKTLYFYILFLCDSSLFFVLKKWRQFK